jgi:hypothetical protein
MEVLLSGKGDAAINALVEDAFHPNLEDEIKALHSRKVRDVTCFMYFEQVCVCMCVLREGLTCGIPGGVVLG